jgi:hypothetical protein
MKKNVNLIYVFGSEAGYLGGESFPCRLVIPAVLPIHASDVPYFVMDKSNLFCCLIILLFRWFQITKWFGDIFKIHHKNLYKKSKW